MPTRIGPSDFPVSVLSADPSRDGTSLGGCSKSVDAETHLVVPNLVNAGCVTFDVPPFNESPIISYAYYWRHMHNLRSPASVWSPGNAIDSPLAGSRLTRSRRYNETVA
jgi:hypothetical protein